MSHGEKRMESLMLLARGGYLGGCCWKSNRHVRMYTEVN